MSIFKDSVSSLSLSLEQLRLLEEYAELIMQWNSQINLTGAKSVEDFLNQHILDALFANHALKKERVSSPVRLYDIGSGCGVPGIVLSIVNPQSEVNLVDSVRNKTLCLEDIVGKLALTAHTKVLNNRFESLGWRDAVDEVWFRAFLPLEKLLLLFSQSRLDARRFPKMVLMKGPRWEEELMQAQKNGAIKGKWLERFEALEVIEYDQPFLETKRYLLVIP